MRAARRRSGALVLGGLLLAGTSRRPPAAARRCPAGRDRLAGAGCPLVHRGSWPVRGQRVRAGGGRRRGHREHVHRRRLHRDRRADGLRGDRESARHLRRPHPERLAGILGRVVAVFADDQPGDPGLFVVGRISAIDGVKVGDAPVHRLHRVGGDWVRDTGWAVDGDCTTGSGTFPIDGTWIATPTQLVYGGYAGPGAMTHSTTGLTVVDRATGTMRIVAGDGCPNPLLPSIPQLAGARRVREPDVLLRGRRVDGVRPSVGPGRRRLPVRRGSLPRAAMAGPASDDLTSGSGGRSWFRLTQVDPTSGPGSRSSSGSFRAASSFAASSRSMPG